MGVHIDAAIKHMGALLHLCLNSLKVGKVQILHDFTHRELCLIITAQSRYWPRSPKCGRKFTETFTQFLHTQKYLEDSEACVPWLFETDQRQSYVCISQKASEAHTTHARKKWSCASQWGGSASLALSLSYQERERTAIISANWGGKNAKNDWIGAQVGRSYLGDCTSSSTNGIVEQYPDPCLRDEWQWWW